MSGVSESRLRQQVLVDTLCKHRSDPLMRLMVELWTLRLEAAKETLVTASVNTVPGMQARALVYRTLLNDMTKASPTGHTLAE